MPRRKPHACEEAGKRERRRARDTRSRRKERCREKIGEANTLRSSKLLSRGRDRLAIVRGLGNAALRVELGRPEFEIGALVSSQRVLESIFLMLVDATSEHASG